MYHILICDDEPDILSALSIYLSTENYKLFTASTGAEALEVVENEEIHLILNQKTIKPRGNFPRGF